MFLKDEPNTKKENDGYVQNDAGQNRKEVLVPKTNIDLSSINKISP